VSTLEYLAGHMPDIILVLGSLLAITILWHYKVDKESKKYNTVLYLGVFVGIVLILLDIIYYSHWNWFTTIMIALLGFSMAVRPFDNISVVMAVAILSAIIAYVLLGNFVTIDGVSALGTGIPRVFCAFIAGVFIYMLLSLSYNTLIAVGTFLNWWPLLLILAFFCLLESFCIFIGYDSFYAFITK